MDLEELKQTDIWELYEKGRNYCRLINMYTDTDKNYEFYNGNQWKGLKYSGIEPIQLNFIKPIIKYKAGVINSNQWAIHYSSENYENKEFRPMAEKTCELLNKKASKIWEKDQMDLKCRQFTKDAGINDEGIVYVTYDEETGIPTNEVIDKNDIQYGNENDMSIQRQPYIIIKQRRSVIEVQEMARLEGVSEEKLSYIKGDNDTFEESGESAKQEKDNMCTLVTKMWKENGTVWFAKAVRYLDIKESTDSGLTYYPVAHMCWEEKKGSARGEGEVRHLIPNQIELNKTLMRRLITVKQTAYPQKVINGEKVANIGDANKIGATLRTKGGMAVDDVNKVFGYINPAQMSPDVEKVQNELISLTRELAGAGDIATGDVNPESASGKAILAVQQAQQQPLTEQLIELKTMLEDLARIWLDILTVYSVDGLVLEEEIKDPETGEEYIQPITIPQSVLLDLQASVKVDITPKGAFDKFAQEVSMENLLKAGYFSPQRLAELKIYVELLDDDSVMPKPKLREAVDLMEEEQRKIAMIQAQAQMLQQRASQFINEDPNAQAEEISQAQQKIAMERMATGEERNGMAEERENIEEETPAE